MKLFELNLDELKNGEEISKVSMNYRKYKQFFYFYLKLGIFLTQIKNQPIGVTINGWLLIENSTVFTVCYFFVR